MYSEYDYIIIGVSDSCSPEFSQHIIDIIRGAKYFSGGKRHFCLVEKYLPLDYKWIEITIPLDNVFNEYNKLKKSSIGPLIVFASGDPLFFGFGATIKKREPNARIKVFPTFNSLQMLAHRFTLGYGDMSVVSLTGRPWLKFDEALIRQYSKIGILTDSVHTPNKIAERALEYGYDNYIMYIGEALGGNNEKLYKVSLSEASSMQFSMPNVVIMHVDNSVSVPHKRKLGLPHTQFKLLDGREKMITKMPVRLLALSLLELYDKNSFWDIGFCTGSVSIEAKLQFPQLDVFSFEIRPECLNLIKENAVKFGAVGITSFIGDFTTMNVEEMINLNILKRPDAVFIGGHGGKLLKIVEIIAPLLFNGGTIVFNAVNDETPFLEAVEAVNLVVEEIVRIKVDEYNTITCCKAVKR